MILRVKRIQSGTFIVAVALLLISACQGAETDDREYQKQLELAREEGIPTTPEEFSATLSVVPESENAAPYYVRATKLKSLLTSEGTQIDHDFAVEPSERNKKKLRAYLQKIKPFLDVMDQAVSKPHCRFEKDWSLGIALLQPELATAKNAAQIYLIKGSLDANEGHPERALANVRKAVRLAIHLSEEPVNISHVISRRMLSMALSKVAYWSFRHRDNEAYRMEFDKLLGGLSLPNLKVEHRFDLVEALSAIELCSSKKGLERLGFTDEDRVNYPPDPPSNAGRAKIVRAMREYWAILVGSPTGLEDRIGRAMRNLDQAFKSFPTAGHIYRSLGESHQNPLDDIDSVVAYQVAYRALSRAFSLKIIPKKVRTDDLISPWDGKPIKYRYDGKRIEVIVGTKPGQGEPLILAIPPKDSKPDSKSTPAPFSGQAK